MGAFMGVARAALAARAAGLSKGQTNFKTLMGVYKSAAAAGRDDGISGNAGKLGLQAVNSYIDRLKNPSAGNSTPLPGQTLATGLPPPQVGVTPLLGRNTLLGQ